MTWQDGPALTPPPPRTEEGAAGAPKRPSRAKQSARRPELPELLRRTLAALERDLPALRAAKLSPSEVAAFLVERLSVLSEPSMPAAQAVVLAALGKLERESPRGALLSVRELRARSGLDKASFDSAALELAGLGRVSLHAHDHPSGLPEPDRRALIEDARGVHYVGIASTPDARREVSL